MSYTQFQSRAIFTVPEDFDLDAFIQGCHDDCIKDENFIWHNYGMSPDSLELVDLTFSDYIVKDGTDVYVVCDTEESHSDTEVWDWLTDRFAPVMDSALMRIESCTNDSRSGMDSDVCFMTKNGTVVRIPELLEAWEKANP